MKAASDRLRGRGRALAERAVGSARLVEALAAARGRLDELERVQAAELSGRPGRPVLWNVVPGEAGRPPRPIADRLDAGADPTARVREALSFFDTLAAGEDLAALGEEALLEELAADALPVPAPIDREMYFDTDDVAYWLSGLADALLLERVAAERERPLAAGQRVLDFGCASGRTLRHLHRRVGGLDLHGADIGTRNVDWIRDHLPAAICAHQTTILPHLPLEDASVDVVHAGSVLTHVDPRLEEATLLELRRVLRPGGFALITVHPERDWPSLCAGTDHWVAGLIHGAAHRLDPPGEIVTPELLRSLAGGMPGPRVVFTNLTVEVNRTNVVHSDAWIAERWGRHFRVERVVERAHGIAQDGIVLSRPEPG